MPSGLALLQKALDENALPDDWPQDVCRYAFCGHWERNRGQYYWHRESDHCPTCRGYRYAVFPNGDVAVCPTCGGDGRTT